MLLQILVVLAPVFLCVLAGWLWRRSKRELDTRQVAQLIIEIGSPCLILATIPTLTLDSKALYGFAGAALSAIAITALLAAIVLRLLRWPWRDFLSPLVFGNHGNMGLSLSLFAFGEQGLALSLVFFTLSTLLHFTLGISTLENRFSPGRTLRSPLVLAMLVSLALLAADMQLPAWLQQTVQLLGDIAIPLMLLALGVSLAQIGTGTVSTGSQLTLLRFISGFGGGLLAASLFDLQDTARNVLLLQASMPAAVFSYLLAEQYRRSPQAVAGYVMISTVTAIPVLVLLLWYLQH